MVCVVRNPTPLHEFKAETKTCGIKYCIEIKATYTTSKVKTK